MQGKVLFPERTKAEEPVEIFHCLFQSFEVRSKTIKKSKVFRVKWNVTIDSTTVRTSSRTFHEKSEVLHLTSLARSQQSRRYFSRNRTTFRGTQRLVSGRRAGVKDLMPTNDEVLCSHVDTN
ncbi:hypothetical protein ANTQUA_LOCUS2179 [Anthophora quadrimaculata]